ncbi:DUF4157 domain-containing protein [Humibacillus xanthopallidus]|uniref:eCIS core domain-containing protein n=1 Tax=Humibacillus xanthopallidus TaxID=412689 RepID=UPI00385005C6
MTAPDLVARRVVLVEQRRPQSHEMRTVDVSRDCHRPSLGILEGRHLLRAGRIAVFAPKIAKAHAKATEVPANGITQQHQKPADVEQAWMLQGPPRRQWDFSRIAASQHGRADGPSSPAVVAQARGPSTPGVDGLGDQLMRVPGEPLEPGVRREAERRFGHDFGNVRVQRGRVAAEATSAVGALAFTLGRHIVAEDGAIDPATDEGHANLLHELTHIVQQAAFEDHELVGAPVLDPAHSSEQEARAGTAAPSPLKAPAIQRAPRKIAKSGQQVEIDLTKSRWRQTLKFEGGQTQIVYVLRDATTGEFLKVGKTTVAKIAKRFDEYVSAGNKWSRKLAADAWTFRARSTINIEAFEAEIRAGLERAGARLPWDNTRVPGKGPRLGRPGQGIPDTKPQTETQFIDEAEQLRVRHAPPNISKRRGMSSKEKAKLKAAEERAATDALAKAEQAPAQVEKVPGPLPTSEVKGGSEGGPATQPKVQAPPAGEAGAGTRVRIEASRFRNAGRFLAREAPGLLLQALLMSLFPPEVHIHNEAYGELSSKKIDPALQHALKEQEAVFNRLAADDPAKTVWAIVTVQSDYWVNATPGGDLNVTLQDLKFVGMRLSREYFLVEGKRFDVGKPGNASKTVIYSVPISGPATHGSEEPIRKYRKVREGLTHSAHKVRLSAMLAMYKIADANPFLKNQLIRDLHAVSNDNDDSVRRLATYMLNRLKPNQ